MTFPATPLGNQWTDGEEINAVKLNARVDQNLNALIPTWTAFTPTWTNLTPGNGVNTGFYTLIGKTLSITVQFLGGSTSSMATGVAVSMTLPAGLTSTSVLTEQYLPAVISCTSIITVGTAALPPNGPSVSFYFPVSNTNVSMSQTNASSYSFGNGSRLAFQGQVIVN